MNEYVSVARLKADIGGSGIQVSDRDSSLLSLAEQTSRAIEDALGGVQFYTTSATRRWDGRNHRDRDSGCVGMFVPGPADYIVSLTTLKVDENDDGTYETTLTEGTDFRLVPLRGKSAPYTRIELIPRGTQISAFPRGYETVQAVGLFGWANESKSLTTLGVAITDAAATTITVANGSLVSAGMTLIVGSERMAATAVAGNVVTVTRGINGSTAATAVISATVSQEVYPGPIVEACLMEASRVWREITTGYGGAPAGFAATQQGGFNFRATYPAIRALLEPYRYWMVA